MSARQRRAKERRRLRRAAALSGTLALGLNASAVAASFTASPVKDVNTIEAGSNPFGAVQIAPGVQIYTADDGVTGRELWKTDGTTAGTTLIKDIRPGGASSLNGIYGTQNRLVNIGGTVYFAADDGTHGRELWKTDGTTAGTVEVKDIKPGPYGGYPANLTNVGGTLMFSASSAGDQELWKSDGTEAGTARVHSFAGTDTPHSFAAVGGTVFFAANDGTNGLELWKSNGTDAGTSMVLDIKPGSSGSYPKSLLNVGGTLYFAADDGTTGVELWKSNGLPAGTVEVKNIDGGSGDSLFGEKYPKLVEMGGNLYFAADDGASGVELWKSTGAVGNATLVKDINGGVSDGLDGLKYASITNVNGTLFFTANDGAAGVELWKSTGAIGNATLVKDIQPGAGDGAALDKYDPSSTIYDVGGTAYLFANDGTTGTELWKSDGSAGGTVIVKDVRSGPNSTTGNIKYLYTMLADLGGGTVIFSAADGTTGSELWRTDGTAGGTSRVANLNTTNLSSFKYSSLGLADVSGTLFYVAGDGTTGPELYKSNGTAAGTGLVKDIFPGERSPGLPQLSLPRELTNLNGTLLFNANDGTHGFELWRSDGTEAGTSLLADIWPGTDSGYPSHLTNVGGTLFFTADDGTNGTALWKTDGTAAGTVLVKDVDPAGDGEFDQFTAAGSTLYFRANDGTNGIELWKSDGTAGGTVQVKDINGGAGGSSPYGLHLVGNTLYFSANDGTHGDELWKTDGTEAGTVPVKDINPGAAGSTPGQITPIGNVFFFSANDGTHGIELWKSDGSEAGTVMVKDINVGPNGSSLSDLAVTGGKLVFSANDGAAGRELWVSDGNDGGTSLIKDFRGGAPSGLDGGLTPFAGKVLFSANDGSTGDELWDTDGTAAGTEPVRDIRTGPASSYPASFFQAGSSLFFGADDGSTGTELWRADVVPTPTPTPSPTPTPTVKKKKPKLTVKVRPKRDRTKPYTFRVKGTVKRPKGITKAQGCNGKVSVVARKQKVKHSKRLKKPLFKKTVKLNKKTCGFTVKAKLNKRAGRRGRAIFTVTFKGNKVLKPVAKKVTVRYG